MAWWIFQNLVVTAALAAVVAVACRATRLGPVARHALWVVVLMKFITPPVVIWPWPAPDPLGVAALVDADREPRLVGDRLRAEQGPAVEVAPTLEHPAEAQVVTRADDLDLARAAASALPWLAAIWVLGSVCLVGLEAIRLRRLFRRLRAARPADPALVTRVAALAAQMGVQPVPVHVVEGLAAPMLWGVGRLRLLWPASLTEESDTVVDGLLVHELAHVRRRDHLVGWIELAAGVLWWWNPLFWYVRAARRDEAELACDAWVVSALPDGRRAYAESLLALSMAGAHTPSPASVLAVRAGTRGVLERRLVMIMKGRTPVRLSRMAIVSLAVLAMTSLPGWAAAPEQSAASQSPRPAPAASAAAAPAPQATVALPATPASAPASPAQATTAAPTPARAARTVQTPAPSAQVKVRDVTVVVADQTKKELRVAILDQSKKEWYVRFSGVGLPAEGQDLLKGFEADREAIEQEADKKIQARREALVKALEALQDTYARAGKLDEAVAIRNYLRAGLPGLTSARRFYVR